jgi:hypothetical protein
MHKNYFLYFLLLGCCLLSVQVFGQTVPTVDVIYLKDGSILKGEILAYEKGAILKIKLANDQKLELADQDIKRIVQEPIDQKVIKEKDPDKDPLNAGRLYHAFYFSGNLGNNIFDDIDWGVGLEHVTGYWLDENWGLGLGGGIIQYSSDISWRVAPVFVDVKLKTRQRSPLYLGADLGLGFPLKNENLNIQSGKAGERVRLGIGKIWNTSSNARITAEISYLHQSVTFDSRTWRWSDEDLTSRNLRFKRYQFRFGFLF